MMGHKSSTRLFACVCAALALLASAGQLLDCVKRAADEEGSSACVETHGASLSDKVEVKDTLEALMSRAFFDITERFVDAAHRAGISQGDLSTSVFQASTRVQRRLSALQDRVSKAQNAAGIPPAFEWAQSPDTIFINVKFAHKLDTPATLGCEADPPVFQEAGVTLRAECKEKRKTFLLSLATFKQLAIDNCTWSMSSVGRASLTLKKAVNGTWPRLLASESRKPGNMHVWWTMKEAHEEANKAWEKLLRDKEKEKEKDAKEEGKDKKDGEGSSTTDTAGSDKDKSAGEGGGDGDKQATATLVPTSTPEPSVTPTPEPTVAAPPTPEDPVTALERQRTRELADTSTGEAAELRAIDEDASSKRKALEDKCRAEKGGIEREVWEARKAATQKWADMRKSTQDKYSQLLETVIAARAQQAQAQADQAQTDSNSAKADL